MWCKHCDTQYEEGFTVCLKCGRELVEYQPIIQEDNSDLLADNVESDAAVPEMIPADATPEKLVTLPEKEEAQELCDRLATINIPAIIKDSDEAQGEYDVFVPAGMFPRAFELVTEDAPELPEEELSDDELMSEFGDMEFYDDVTDVDPDEIAKRMNENQ